MCSRIPLEKDKEITFDGRSFKIGGVCGYGTSSIVYYAEDIGNKNQVIVKEIYPAGLGITRNDDGSLAIPTESKDIFDEYIKRAEKAYELQTELHNNVSTNNATLFTYAQGKDKNTYYCASELKAGCTLSDWIKNHKGDNKAYIPGLLKICRHITGVLKAYHENEPSYIHLDIKPANILVVPIDEKDYIIQMFDFDSVYTIEELKNDYVRYSPRYAAPEVMYFPYNIDIDHTDIFSVGAILYEGIFGKPPGDEETEVWHQFDFSEVRALDSFSPELKPKLTEILKKTLSIVVSSRFTAGELYNSELDEAIEIAQQELFIRDRDIRSELSNVVKRDAELSDIHNALTEQGKKGKKAAYICGTGGTGKTELALQYAEKYRTYYHTIQKVNYRKNLETTISDIEISTGKADIKSFCEILNNEILGNTLIIIDNLGTANGDSAVLKMLLEHDKKVHFILTSRDKPDNINNYFHEISTDNIANDLKRKIKKMVFRIAGKKRLKYYKNEIKTFLKAIDYHFLTSSLFAELSRDILMTSPERYPIFLKTLKEQGISSPEIQNRKRERFFEKIIKIFHKRKPFTEEEKIIMLNASLLPPFGMPEGEFLEYIKADITPTIGNSPVCDALVKRNWLRRETRNKYYISMHPIIREVCVSELIFETQKPFNFDLFIPLLRGLSSKLDLSAGNTEYIFLSLAVCNSLSKLSKAKNTELSPEILPLIENIKNKGINYKDQMKLLSSILCDECKGVLNPLLTNFADFFKINS